MVGTAVVVIVLAVLTSNYPPPTRSSTTSSQAKDTPNPISLTQKQIEANVLARAQIIGLEGSPTSIVARQIPLGEFMARLLPQVPDSHKHSPDTPVWLVIIKGNIKFKNTFPNLNATGVADISTLSSFPAMWLVSDTTGYISRWAGLPSGQDIDFNSFTVITPGTGDGKSVK